MCGIVGIFGGTPPALDAERAVAALAHRGPDDRQVWSEGPVALGHARLSIVDLAGGRQPIVNERAAIVVNGELYGHDAQLAALAQRGHRLQTASDSEVVLHLYEELGVGCLAELRGQFAFVLWDRHKRLLFAARDRFGIKPLIFAEHAGRLILASEIKALFAAGLPPRWDEQSAYAQLCFAGQPDRTLFRGVHQLLPGHYLLADAKGFQTERYWDADFPRREHVARPRAEAARIDIGARLDEAVALRTRADVPIGCYLSGGVDSSTVLALAARHTPLHAFTVAFEGREHDESRAATEMARHANVALSVVKMRDDDYADVFAAAAFHAEGLLYNGHAPARYQMACAARRAGIKVVLGGEGADELFLGYHFAERALAASVRPRAMSLLRRLARWPTADERHLATVSPLLALTARLIGFPDALLASLCRQSEPWRRVLSRDLLERHRDRDPHRELLSSLRWRKQILGREPVRQIVYIWLKSFFPGYVLAGERMDMAHGVEARLPFLDHELFAAVRELAADVIYREGQNKHLLRQIARPHITPTIYRAPKRPFLAPPTAARRRHPLHELARDMVGGQSFSSLPFFDAAKLRGLLDEPNATHDALLYVVGSLAVLQERFRPSC